MVETALPSVQENKEELQAEHKEITQEEEEKAAGNAQELEQIPSVVDEPTMEAIRESFSHFRHNAEDF